jgi:hypothetical protein
MYPELWMKDKIVPIYEHALAGQYAASPAVARLERELFCAGERIYIVNAKGSIRRNIGKVLGRGMRGRPPFRPGQKSYRTAALYTLLSAVPLARSVLTLIHSWSYPARMLHLSLRSMDQSREAACTLV